jgi:hypothetical protein
MDMSMKEGAIAYTWGRFAILMSVLDAVDGSSTGT